MSRRKGIQLLAFGTLGAQLITISATPILTRLYDPATFSILALVVSISNTLGVVAHGRLTVAVAAASSREEAHRAFSDGQRLIIISSAVAAGLLLAAHYLGLAQDFRPEVVLLGTLAGAGVAALDLHAFYRNSSSAYKLSATTAVFRSVATVAFQISLYFLGGIGLATGVLLGVYAALLFSIWRIRKQFNFSSFPRHARMSPAWLRETLVRHKHYLLFSAPQALMSAIGHNSPPIILALTTSPAFVGHYWLAFRLLVAPISILGGSYRQASIPSFRKAHDGGRHIVVRDTIFLAALVGCGGAALAIFGPTAFALVFGSQWRESGLIAGVLVIGYGADLIKVPAICFLQAQRREKVLLAAESATVVAKLSTLAASSLLLPPLPSLTIFACVSAGCALLLTVMTVVRSRLGEDVA